MRCTLCWWLVGRLKVNRFINLNDVFSPFLRPRRPIEERTDEKRIQALANDQHSRQRFEFGWCALPIHRFGTTRENRLASLRLFAVQADERKNCIGLALCFWPLRIGTAIFKHPWPYQTTWSAFSWRQLLYCRVWWLRSNTTRSTCRKNCLNCWQWLRKKISIFIANLHNGVVQW